MKEKQLPTEDVKVSWKTRLWNSYLASIPVIDFLTGYHGIKHRKPEGPGIGDLLFPKELFPDDPPDEEEPSDIDEPNFLPRPPKK